MDDQSPIPVVLLANKCDLLDELKSTFLNKMDQFCEENRFCGWFQTSAKNERNVKESIKFLVDSILKTNSFKKVLSDNGVEASPKEDGSFTLKKEEEKIEPIKIEKKCCN
eukprot:TRINITY_DN3170_c3_g1_i2.p1 TRINITY_DN3170_c3_g1~~TRINITY_DN3170_c3_g1_i2.p1  ORF type:complete len:110 (-),score=37.75 TRINITY_DN3170_c3_g1_i2:34-363(-)